MEEKVVEQRAVYITKYDLARLQELLKVAHTFGARDTEYLDRLEEELERGHVVGAKEVPADVITMNSRVLLQDAKTGEQFTYTLVFPTDANPSEGKLSVLAPLGTAMLGYSVGQTVEWPTPSGVRRLQVVSLLYQPEAAGDYHL
jgi:regulator of nucleoside diphosphate kinase